jgi:hypothetical protein
MPQANAPATSTAKGGWGSEGVVVLNQQISGGKTTTLSDAAAKALHADAEAQYRRFTKQH